MISKGPSRPKMLAIFRLLKLRTGNLILDLINIINILRIMFFNMGTSLFVDLNNES